MVLRGDLDLARREVLDRVVGAAVAERELVRRPAHAHGQHLVTEADAEHRHPGFGGDLGVAPDIVERGGIARPVAEEDPGRSGRQHVLGRRRRREHLDVEPVVGEAPQDVPLHAEVVGSDGAPLAGHA
jgi:hypothetical protein